jgi:coenzyme PQQ biosynthesis protein PqqD
LSGESLLLYPEKGLALSSTGASILELCDGTRSVREIAATLAARYEASPQEIGADVLAFLSGLAGRGLLRAEASAS